MQARWASLHRHLIFPPFMSSRGRSLRSSPAGVTEATPGDILEGSRPCPDMAGHRQLPPSAWVAVTRPRPPGRSCPPQGPFQQDVEAGGKVAQHLLVSSPRATLRTSRFQRRGSQAGAPQRPLPVRLGEVVLYQRAAPTSLWLPLPHVCRPHPARPPFRDLVIAPLSLPWDLDRQGRPLPSIAGFRGIKKHLLALTSAPRSHGDSALPFTVPPPPRP